GRGDHGVPALLEIGQETADDLCRLHQLSSFTWSVAGWSAAQWSAAQWSAAQWSVAQWSVANGPPAGDRRLGGHRPGVNRPAPGPGPARGAPCAPAGLRG